jgi:maleate cis-trans isomerase
MSKQVPKEAIELAKAGIAAITDMFISCDSTESRAILEKLKKDLERLKRDNDDANTEQSR